MDSLPTIQRQLRRALLAILLVVVIGVLGYRLIENLSLLDAIWMTVVTLATIGYGDIVPLTTAGRIFTIFLIITGLSVFAYGLQASATLIISPALRDARQRRRIQRAIDRLNQHYVICGAGELVDKTVDYLLESAKRRQLAHLEQLYHPIDAVLDHIFGDDADGHFPRLRVWLRSLFHFIVRKIHQAETLLDVVVVVTPHPAFAHHLRANNLLVIEGDPTTDEVLHQAGLQHAHALVILLDSDTETLLTVLTGRTLSPELDITAAMQDETLAPQMVRAGANRVIPPFEVAGKFLNNATLRPAVNDFFNTILYNPHSDLQTTALPLGADSPWIGQPLGSLRLRERFQAGIIGVRLENNRYQCTPDNNYVLQAHEILIAVAPAARISQLQQACRRHTAPLPTQTWSRPPVPTANPPAASDPLPAIATLSRHVIVCGSGQIARCAIDQLNPQRPFVIISEDATYTDELRARGFRVVQGSPAQEHTLQEAGVERALAIMIALDDPASSVLTVLNCRALSKHLLITAAALTDEMLPKLRRAGADRVVSPFQAAAAFVLLTATRPAVSDFLQHIVFNPQVGMETTELYMQDNSPWRGRTLQSLELEARYGASVIGLRLADEQYLYAPPGDHILRDHEVLIVVTPMQYSDELREQAHGSETRRPNTLRTGKTQPLSPAFRRSSR
ncbi:MAG TPA: NAD-binding protein [Phototrophicaceae bacterium]|nr:NAD-binding protein [Phototrophicaceae bacterium]